MIQIFNKLQTETANLKFIKTIEGENPQHYHYEFEARFDLELLLRYSTVQKLSFQELSKLYKL